MTGIVLLGAGASFGSIDASPSTPHLGGQLFDALASRGGLAATLPDDLKITFRANLDAA